MSADYYKNKMKEGERVKRLEEESNKLKAEKDDLTDAFKAVYVELHDIKAAFREVLTDAMTLG